MTSQQERIAQFRKMASDDPDNELGHFSLAKALMEAGEPGEAATSFERTTALNPEFSKAYQLLGACYTKVGQRDKAVQILKEGFAVADGRGDNVPRDEMAKMLGELGESPPASKKAAASAPPGDGFQCQRPGCRLGSHARRLPAPPTRDPVGQQVFDKICADCWREWLGMGVKVINEMRLDLSDDRAQQVYDTHMKEYLGLA